MKPKSRLVRIAALLLLLAMLSACNQNRPPVQTGEPDASDSSAEGIDKSEYIRISGGEYTLIRPDNTSQNMTEIFRLLFNGLSGLQGNRFAYGDDFVGNGEEIPQTNREILIGKTNRSDSAELTATLAKKEWRVAVKDAHILITGADDVALWQAASYFLADCVTVLDDGLYVSRSLDQRGSRIDLDNSARIPAIRPDSETQLLKTSSDGDAYTPDWVNDLIIVEANLVNATSDGTLEAAKTEIIDHLAELGVNGLWLTPIGDRSDARYFYGNLGLDTIDQKLTGTADYEKGWAKFADFVAYAHSKNIRVFMDVVTWGTSADSHLYREHPDWYSGESAWSGLAFDWNNAELREWYAATCTDLILQTGVDGLRCDCEPEYAGYELFADIRGRCLENGRKIIIFSEHSNTRDGAFDFEQFGVFNYTAVSFSDQQEKKINWFMGNTGILYAIRNSVMIGDTKEEIKNKSAYYRYFTYCVSCHDYSGTAVNGNQLTLAYQALYAPFIPIWYIGEEFGWKGSGSLLYAKVNWSDAESIRNHIFYEQIKQLIAIRREYADIFSVFNENHRESNICAVVTEGFGELAAYARYNESRAILIVPNTSGADAQGNIKVPFSSMKLDAKATWQIQDLITGEIIATGTGSEIAAFQATIADQTLGVYLIEPISQ